MSPKKGYKRQLPRVIPTVVPPTPRRPPEQDAVEPAPAAAAPAPAPKAATPPPVTTAFTPIPRIVAPRSPEPAAPTTPSEPRVVETPAPRRRAPAVVALLALVVVAVAGGVATWWLARDEPEQPTPAPPAVANVWPDPGASRTVTRVRADGALEVVHRIHTKEPIDELALTLPETGLVTPVEATEVEVVANGRPALGPNTISFAKATYLFAGARTVLVRYRLDGAIERSASASGRGLVTTTALTVSATQPDDTRVVRSAAVLSLACASSAGATLAPCGESDGEGEWRVRLTASEAGSRVVASVTLPS